MQATQSITVSQLASLDNTRATQRKRSLEVACQPKITKMINSIPAPAIDWSSLKSQYDRWRMRLWQTTGLTLTKMARENVSLAALNTLGIFHSEITSEADSMKQEYEAAGIVPHRWIYKKSFFAGILCSLFHWENSYSIAFNISIFKFTFKPEYRIFDPRLDEHTKMWEAWKSVKKNTAKPNPWKSDKNDQEISMKNRMLEMPDHLAFYKEHRFGAVVGYSDYIRCVIIQEEAIATVSLLEPRGGQKELRPMFKQLAGVHKL